MNAVFERVLKLMSASGRKGVFIFVVAVSGVCPVRFVGFLPDPFLFLGVYPPILCEQVPAAQRLTDDGAPQSPLMIELSRRVVSVKDLRIKILSFELKSSFQGGLNLTTRRTWCMTLLLCSMGSVRHCGLIVCKVGKKDFAIWNQ